jgi:hypothetical protein
LRLLVAIVIWVAAIGAAAELSSAVAGSIHVNHSSSIVSAGGSEPATGGSTPGAGVTPSPPFDASKVKATDPLSLFATHNLIKALTTARRQLGTRSKLTELVIYPGYLDITGVRGDNELDIYVNAEGSTTTNTVSGAAGGEPTFSLSKIDAAAPAALAHRIAVAGHTAEAQLGYMVAQVELGENTFHWLIYPRQGNRVEYFEASGPTGELFALRANSSEGPEPVR